MAVTGYARNGVLARAQIGDSAARGNFHDPTAIQTREHGGETVIIVLRPAVERMIVAVGALQPHAHEYGAHEFGLAARVANHAREVSRADHVRISGRGQQRAGHLVQRCAFFDLLAHPVVEYAGSFAVVWLRADTEEVGEAPSPVIDEGVALQEL